MPRAARRRGDRPRLQPDRHVAVVLRGETVSVVYGGDLGELIGAEIREQAADGRKNYRARVPLGERQDGLTSDARQPRSSRLELYVATRHVRGRLDAQAVPCEVVQHPGEVVLGDLLAIPAELLPDVREYAAHGAPPAALHGWALADLLHQVVDGAVQHLQCATTAYGTRSGGGDDRRHGESSRGVHAGRHVQQLFQRLI